MKPQTSKSGIARSRFIKSRYGIGGALLTALLLASLLLSTSCTMAKGYRGPSQDVDNLALLRAHGVTVHQSNDIEVGATASGVLIPAGENVLYLSINASNYNTGADPLKLHELRVVVEAGKEYVITAERGAGKVCAWPLEQQTGQPRFENPAGCVER